MPIEVALWRLGSSLERIAFTPMEKESRLEDILAADVGIADPNVLLIGRQVPTLYGKFIDLLGIDGDGNLVVFELKKDRTPREVVAQLLDYGSWVRTLDDDDIAGIFGTYLGKYFPDHASTSLDQAFCERFGVKEMPESLNESHELVVVAGNLDDSTERIISYLADEYGVAINAVFFRFFRDGDSEYLSRAWLIDPGEIETKVEAKHDLPWNGEFYASFGANENRDWEEARKYGFFSAGGGSWHTKPMGMLEPGARVWVNVPGEGYVGVGTVVDEPVPISDFHVENGDGRLVPITQLDIKAARESEKSAEADTPQHFVRMKWIKTVPVSEAVREKGFFGNQNSVAKPRAKRWRHTVERLKTKFGIAD